MANSTASPPTNALGGRFDQEPVDAVWIVVCTFIIFTMQSGFALLESGLFVLLLLFFVYLFIFFLSFFLTFITVMC